MGRSVVTVLIVRNLLFGISDWFHILYIHLPSYMPSFINQSCYSHSTNHLRAYVPPQPMSVSFPYSGRHRKIRPGDRSLSSRLPSRQHHMCYTPIPEGCGRIIAAIVQVSIIEVILLAYTISCRINIRQ